MDAVIGIANESAAEVATVSAKPIQVGIFWNTLFAVIFLLEGLDAGLSTT